jgi:GNAT superfamily N-acetyltransferase
MAGNLTIQEVKTNSDLMKFIKFPFKLYKNDKLWVPPLISEEKKLFNRGKNPFWKHADFQAFLAIRDGEIVGRVAGLIDERHNEVHKDKVGFFGFFESINDQEVAKALLDAVKEWIKGKGRNIFRGPMSPSQNDIFGILIEGLEYPPQIMMPYNPPYYKELLENYGLAKAKDMLSFYKDSNVGIPARIKRISEITRKRTKVTVRPMDTKHLDRDVEIIKDLYNKAWELNWGFVPLTDEEMDDVYKKLLKFYEPDLVLIAEVEGKPVGVGISVPDINQVLIKIKNGKLFPFGIFKFLWYKRKINCVRCMIFGLLKEYRKTGIPLVMFEETEKNGLRHGYMQAEIGWNLEDNDAINQFDSQIGGRIYKRQRVYQMPIK